MVVVNNNDKVIAYSFVDNPIDINDLKGSRPYELREKINNGEKLSREERNYITSAVNRCVTSKPHTAIALMGWLFNFEDALKRFIVIYSDGYIAQIYASDITALRAYICDRYAEVHQINKPRKY